MRPITDPMVMAGPLLQPIRGLLFGALLFMLRHTFFATQWGWQRLWLVLVVFGIVGPPGPALGSLEGMIYTKIPLWVQLTGPEVVLQTLVFSGSSATGSTTPEADYGSARCLGVVFAVEYALTALGLLASRAGIH